MRITFLTLFPEMYEGFITTSIIRRAIEREIVEIDFVNIRDFALDRFKHVDDYPFGGGQGMILKCQPVYDALNSVRQDNSHVILMAAAWQTFTQAKAHDYTQYEHLIIICGHYEGIDARIYDMVDELVSIGDYVLTGGELASMVIADSVIRLLKGSILEASHEDESYENGLLEYPQYTKPADFMGIKVPDVLLSGHHENIRKYRLKESLRWTMKYRPDMLEGREYTKEEKKLMAELKAEAEEE